MKDPRVKTVENLDQFNIEIIVDYFLIAEQSLL